MSTKDPLVEWPLEKWGDLKESFKNRWPFSAYAYYMLEIQEKWWKNDNKAVKIYVPYGDVNNGMVATFELTEVLYAVFIFSLNDNLTPMSEALLTTKNVDWSRRHGLLMKGIIAPVYDTLLEVYKKLGMKISWEYPSKCIYKKRDLAQRSTFECPNEVYIVPLNKEHALTMNENWPHKFPGSVKFFETVIEQNGGFGLLTKSGGELIAWVSQNEFGGLCHLYCVEGHRRKGYAQILIRRQERKIAQDGHDIHAFIVAHNVISVALFNKMEYETYNGATWMHVIKAGNEGNSDLLSFCGR